MNTYDFVHLVIHAAGDSVQGRTKLQKLVYFVGALTGNLERLGYRPHYYGPYSPDVAGAVQELRGLKFLEQQVSSAGSVSHQGFEVSRYDYKLTDEGKEVAEEKANAEPESWQKLADAIQRIHSANGQDYVRLAIAAKTHLITKSAGQVLPSNVLKSKAAEHGWTFSPDQYDEALRFLERVGLKPPAARS
jgi:uncharacterized protein YwgA